MNDFTKEELEEFLDAIEWKLGEGQADKLTFLLQDRLKSMIDNYRDPNCIHEIDKNIKACKLCGLPSSSIPCVGGWL